MAAAYVDIYRNYTNTDMTINNDYRETDALPSIETLGWERPGYTFAGYNTARNGSGTMFSAGDIPTPNSVVYAQWSELIVYTTTDAELTSVADAIRAKGGTAGELSYPAGFVSAINDIQTGGEGYTIDDIAERTIIRGDIYGGSASFIASYAFAYCSGLTTVSFPAATFIGGSAFADCSGLKTARFPMVTSIGSYAFISCRGLTTVSFPATTLIGMRAFSGCTGLTTVSFPAATSIGANAFSGCTGLTTVSFPVATSIGTDAFNYCTNLTTANLPAATSFGWTVFSHCHKLVSLYLDGVSRVPTLGANCFASTPIGGYTASTGGVYGSVFVPASLYDAFLTAANWSSISARIVSV